MKAFRILTVSFLLVAATTTSYAQKIKLIEGKLPNLANEKTINLEYGYNNMAVGKYDKEADYVREKTEEYNKKEPGRGDNWAKSWVADRENRFQPKFEELFMKYSDMTFSSEAKYTIIFNTTFMEPGFNIGITRKNATMSGDALIVETANKSKILAKISVDKAPGGALWGTDLDTGTRIAETYATAARALAKFVKKNG